MAKKAPKATKDRSGAWERIATRNAILDAARRVAERDGVSRLSLNSVAKEAEFAPATVYAYFSNKNDLLVSAIADDLAKLALAMRVGFKFEDDEASATGEADSSAPHIAHDGAEPNGVRDRVVKPSTTVDARSLAKETAREPELPNKLPMAGSLTQLKAVRASRMSVIQNRTQSAPANEPPGSEMDAIAKLQEAVARLETRPVDAWLERRLREFERALSNLETFQQEAARTATAGETPTGAALCEVRARLDAVEKGPREVIDEFAANVGRRIDALEKRMAQSLSDTQALVEHSASRIVALENVAFAAAPQFFERIAPAPSSAAADIDDQPKPIVAPGQAEAANEDRSEGAAQSYLTAARRSAQAAALSLQRPDRTRRARRLLKVSTRTLYLVAGCALLAFLLVATGVVLRTRALSFEQSMPGKASPAIEHASVRVPERGVATDRAQLTLLANAGNEQAELFLALAALDAKTDPKNKTMAVQWLAHAAAQGNAIAQYRLGNLYQAGQVISADPVLAFHWYESAALQGNRKAMHSLAVAYAEGWGTPKNFAEAARWFSRAAALGFVNSQFNLGVLYERGLGVPQSLLDAYKWYAIAAARGDAESKVRIAALGSQLGVNDLAAAQLGADEFKPEPMQRSANVPPAIANLSGR